MPPVFSAVWSCWRPGRNAPVHNVLPPGSVMTVAFLVFCLFLPEMNARRPGRFALGLRTWTSVPSIRRVTPSAAAQTNTSASVRNRTPLVPGAAKPRAASSGRISCTARVIVVPPR